MQLHLFSQPVEDTESSDICVDGSDLLDVENIYNRKSRKYFNAGLFMKMVSFVHTFN